MVDNRSTAVSDGDARTMVRACNMFIPEVATAWSLPTPSVLFAKDIASTPTDAWLFHIIDADSSEPGMLAYHEETGNVPDGYILARTILQNGGSILYAGTKPTVASALFHEIAESLIDPDCNSWWQAPNGVRYAAEIVDPVQSQIVSITMTPDDSPSTPMPIPVQPSVPPAESTPYNLFAPTSASSLPIAPPMLPIVPPAASPSSIPFNIFAPGWQPPPLIASSTLMPAMSTLIPVPTPVPTRNFYTSVPGDSPPPCTGCRTNIEANLASTGASTVGLSDFVYPAWCDAGAKPGSRFSYSGIVTAPFRISAGGYCITVTGAGPPTNTYGEKMPSWVRGIKERASRVLARSITHPGQP